ncbi:MAG: preprotein translocase subunit SecG [Armatimonadota bacterium]
MSIVATILTVVLFVLSLLLIFVVSAQTPKNEGFGGGVVNTPGGNFRGKAGYDEVLSNYTRTIAIAWIVTALLVGAASR